MFIIFRQISNNVILVRITKLRTMYSTQNIGGAGALCLLLTIGFSYALPLDISMWMKTHNKSDC